MAVEEEVMKKKLIRYMAISRVYSLLTVYFDPYYDAILVTDRITRALADKEKLEKIRACLDSYAREEDQLWCIMKEAGVEDMWLKYKNIIGTRAGLRKANA
jgi:hypothetical protein